MAIVQPSGEWSWNKHYMVCEGRCLLFMEPQIFIMYFTAIFYISGDRWTLPEELKRTDEDD